MSTTIYYAKCASISGKNLGPIIDLKIIQLTAKLDTTEMQTQWNVKYVLETL